MIECREDARLALKAHEAVAIGRELWGRILIASSRPSFRFARPIDFAHSTGADGGKDFVRAESSSGGKGHVQLRRCKPHPFVMSQTPARKMPGSK